LKKHFLRFLSFILLGTACFLAGCAYRLGPVERTLPGGFQSVAIPIFKNLTQEPGIETTFTHAILQEFERSRVAKVTAESLADVVIVGEITSISYIPSGKRTSNELALLPTGAVLATEYRILMRTRVSVLRNSDRTSLWASEFTGERTYSSPQVASPVVNTVNPLYNLSARRQNIEIMAADMMTEAHDRITENF
jgi:hypothetical protein